MSQTVPLILQDDVEQGEKDIEDDGIENDFAYRNNVANSTKAIRYAFLRKVYGLLGTQLLLTTIIASVCLFIEPVKEFVQSNVWLMYIAIFGSFAILLALFVYRKESPTNLILLAAFTFVEAYTIGVTVSFFSQKIVVEALILTLCVMVALTAYTYQTKRDFSSMHSALLAGLIILIIGGFLEIFIQSSVFELVISFGGALLFSLFVIFDTQMIMQTVSAEEYILATITLYLDILNLFLYILRILNELNRQ